LGETLKAVFNITQGGLVVFGSLIGGAVAALLWIHKHRLPVLVMGDLMAPSIVLGMAIGRIGCFFNGCCFGGACDLPWAVHFPWGSPPFMQQVEQGKLSLYGLRFAGTSNDPAIIKSVDSDSLADRAGLKPGQKVERVSAQTGDRPGGREWKVDNVADAQSAIMYVKEPGAELRLRVSEGMSESTKTFGWTLPDVLPRTGPIHPTQIYSAIDAFLLFFVLLAYEPFQRRSGELLALMLTLHPISRFLLEVIRIDEASMFGTGLSISQLISMGAIVGAFVLWGYILRQPRRDVQPAPA
jgi:phosphatidylglycerol:prolipoprotein diacylglycerol transferase